MIRDEVDRDLVVTPAPRGPPAHARDVEDRLARPAPEQEVSRSDRGARIAGNVARGAGLHRERRDEHRGGKHEAGVHAGCTTRSGDEVPANCASKGMRSKVRCGLTRDMRDLATHARPGGAFW